MWWYQGLASCLNFEQCLRVSQAPKLLVGSADTSVMTSSLFNNSLPNLASFMFQQMRFWEHSPGDLLHQPQSQRIPISDNSQVRNRSFLTRFYLCKLCLCLYCVPAVIFVFLFWRWKSLVLCSLHFFFFFCLFRVIPAAYGSSQARDWIGTVAASLHHSNINARSELHLQPALQLEATPDP